MKATFAAPLTVLASTALLAVSLNTQATPKPDSPPPPPNTKTAIFAGGCFWCMESDFEKLNGVIEAVSGYAGGKSPNPTYKQVSAGGTGHAEVVQVAYNPSVVSYEELLKHFWKNVDPTTPDQQFCDRGDQYRAAIMPSNQAEESAARSSLATIRDSGRFDVIHVTIESPGTFWKAEEYHQDYYKKNPIRYRWYRHGCGRDKRLEEIWK